MESAELRAIPLQLRTACIEGSTYLVEVEGEVDLYSASELMQCLERLLENGARTLIVDLTRTAFIDSTGLGVLVAGTKMTRVRHGELHIVGARPTTAAVFDTAGVRTFLSVLPKVADALARI